MRISIRGDDISVVSSPISGVVAPGEVTVTDVVHIGAGPATGQLLGVVRVDDRPVAPIHWSPEQDLADAVQTLLSEASMQVERIAAPRPVLEPLSIVVATLHRPEFLARCLASLTAVDTSPMEVIVVDNGPDRPDTRRVVDAAREHASGSTIVRYEAEPVPGASRARNVGWRAASHGLIAFCDDDCIVDRHWAEGLSRGFADDSVGVVTGQVLPAELTTLAQVYFEEYGGFGRGPLPQLYDLNANRPASRFFPYTAGRFGSGNNAAFRADVLREVGGFSVALGPGTAAKAGEDLDLFVAAVFAGHRLAYEPSALLWHTHRREMPELESQLRSYGTGLSAMVTRQALLGPTAAWRVARLAGPGARLVLSSRSEKNERRSTAYPRRLVRAELRGLLVGPLALGRAVVASRRVPTTQSAPPTTESERSTPQLSGVRARLARVHGMDHLYRSALALGFNTVGTSALGLVYWALAARLYPAVDVGRASALIAAMTVCSGIAQLNLLQGLPRFIPISGRQTSELVRRAYVFCSTFAVVIALAALGVAHLTGWGQAYLATSWGQATWFVAAVVAWTLFTIQDAALIGLRQSVWIPIENLSFAVVKVVLLVALASATQSHGIFASYTLPVALSVVPVGWFLFRRAIPEREARATSGLSVSLRTLRAHVATDYLGSLAYLLSMAGLPLLVAARSSLGATAFFSTTWMLGVSFDLVLSGFTTALLVEASGDPERLSMLMRRLLRLCGVVLVPALVLTAVAAPLFLGVLGPDYATAATPLLRLVAAAMILRIVTLVSFACWRVEHRVRNVLGAQGFLAVTILTLSSIFIGPYGITGVGWAFLIGQGTVAACCAWSLVTRLHVHRSLVSGVPE